MRFVLTSTLLDLLRDHRGRLRRKILRRVALPAVRGQALGGELRRLDGRAGVLPMRGARLDRWTARRVSRGRHGCTRIADPRGAGMLDRGGELGTNAARWVVGVWDDWMGVDFIG
jgi:hypothetical protein